jgi:hypothetical protein
VGYNATLMMERCARRDEMAQRIAAICQKGSVKVLSARGTGSSMFVVEDAAGTQYTVTVARRRQQDSS